MEKLTKQEVIVVTSYTAIVATGGYLLGRFVIEPVGKQIGHSLSNMKDKLVKKEDEK